MKFIAHYDEQAAAMCLAARCFQRRSTDEAAVLQLSQRKKTTFFFFFPHTQNHSSLFPFKQQLCGFQQEWWQSVELQAQRGAK